MNATTTTNREDQMSTTTVIETMPCNWDSGDSMGEWEQGPDAAGRAWRAAFEAYLTANYPHCSLVGNEIYAPATYRFDGLDMQRDTPKRAALKPLPDDGIYAEFQEIYRDDWCEVIEQYIK
jgi:hypothetical protein